MLFQRFLVRSYFCCKWSFFSKNVNVFWVLGIIFLKPIVKVREKRNFNSKIWLCTYKPIKMWEVCIQRFLSKGTQRIVFMSTFLTTKNNSNYLVISHGGKSGKSMPQKHLNVSSNQYIRILQKNNAKRFVFLKRKCVFLIPREHI